MFVLHFKDVRSCLLLKTTFLYNEQNENEKFGVSFAKEDHCSWDLMQKAHRLIAIVAVAERGKPGFVGINVILHLYCY